MPDVPDEMFDAVGRFDLSDDDRDLLRAMWLAPRERALFKKIQEMSRRRLFNILRTCGKDQIDKVRGMLDGLEQFYDLLDDTCKDEKELAVEEHRAPVVI